MKVVLINPPHSQYGTMFHYTQKLYEAFLNCGAQSHIISGEYVNNPSVLKKEIEKHSPDFTLSFNGLLPDSYGNFFCDVVQIPHVAFLLDSPTRFIPIFKSHLTTVICPDRELFAYIKKYKKKNLFFCPIGVEKEITYSDDQRKYPLTMLTSCIDYQAIFDSWSKRFNKTIVRALEEAAFITLSDTKTSYIQALIQSMKIHKINPLDIDYPLIFNELEDYIRGRERVTLLNSLRDCEVHLFGKSLGKRGWDYFLKNKKANITYHQSVPFSEALDIMGQSKIVVNSCPSYKYGFHTRLLLAFGKGALPLTNDNVFIREHFEEDKEVALFHTGKMDAINKTIHTYLENEPLRQEVTEAGRKKVMQNHTWDQRAEFLLNLIS